MTTARSPLAIPAFPGLRAQRHRQRGRRYLCEPEWPGAQAAQPGKPPLGHRVPDLPGVHCYLHKAQYGGRIAAAALRPSGSAPVMATCGRGPGGGANPVPAQGLSRNCRAALTHSRAHLPRSCGRRVRRAGGGAGLGEPGTSAVFFRGRGAVRPAQAPASAGAALWAAARRYGVIVRDRGLMIARVRAGSCLWRLPLAPPIGEPFPSSGVQRSTMMRPWRRSGHELTPTRPVHGWRGHLRNA